jgi:Arc/MetJ-type ribon-helix-helix transcriptional regulator
MDDTKKMLVRLDDDLHARILNTAILRAVQRGEYSGIGAVVRRALDEALQPLTTIIEALGMQDQAKVEAARAALVGRMDRGRIRYAKRVAEEVSE